MAINESTSSISLRHPSLAATWQSDAACAAPNVDPDYFFPEEKITKFSGAGSRAKRICADCPVRDECLRAALDGREAAGIWGGLSPLERYALGGPRPRGARTVNDA
ncbi:WhiB family transcriptional regulator [Streptomyces sp. NPDC057271]|uniref:WhiB family transcriptional regulator n=1 Tax=unclassified Streptomyces TaxID=2593676 RepID=UPI00364561C5